MNKNWKTIDTNDNIFLLHTFENRLKVIRATKAIRTIFISSSYNFFCFCLWIYTFTTLVSVCAHSFKKYNIILIHSFRMHCVCVCVCTVWESDTNKSVSQLIRSLKTEVYETGLIWEQEERRNWRLTTRAITAATATTTANIQILTLFMLKYILSFRAIE